MKDDSNRNYITEIALFQAIFYIFLWIINEYVANLITFILVPIFTAILIISIIAEKIEKSKVSRSYFLGIFLSIIIPLVIYGLFQFIYKGSTDWLTD